MFGRVRELIQNTKELDETKMFKTIVSEDDTQAFILFLNRAEQLFKKGIDADGNVIGEYAAFTELINEGQTFSYAGETKQKIAGEPYMLFDSGNLFKSFKVKVFSDGSFIITANDEKYGDLVSANLVGLTTQSKNDLVENILIQKFQKETREAILKHR